MTNFFAGISAEDAESIDRLTKLMFELRENRRKLLQDYGVEDEAQIEKCIRDGSLEEHPAYEDYLSMRQLAMARDAIRDDLKEYLKEL